MATITKRNNTYLIRVSAGFDGSGKRITKCLTWKPEQGMTEKQAEKEAQRQAVLFEEKCRTGQVLDSNTRFADFTDIWLKDYAEKQLRPRTLSSYKALLERILIAFGNMKLNAIQPHHINEFYSNLAETGVREDIKYKPCVDFRELIKQQGLTQSTFSSKAEVSISVIKSCIDNKNIAAISAKKISKALEQSVDNLFEQQDDIGLSNNTIHHYHSVLSIIFQTAVVWQVIFNNPCDRVKPPKIPKKEARYLDEFEASTLLAALSDEPFRYKVMIQLLIFTGLRRAELCGLEWCDVDFYTNAKKYF